MLLTITNYNCTKTGLKTLQQPNGILPALIVFVKHVLPLHVNEPVLL